ncbi:MAG: hypothetical protein HC938_16095, partial [Nitrospira sp.]|nr:hypothetical protein [Nitrospira sp.]
DRVPDGGSLRGDIATNGFSNSRQGAVSIGLTGGGLRLPLVGQTGYRVRFTSRIAGNAAAPDYFLTNTGFRELNGSATLGVHRPWGLGGSHAQSLRHRAWCVADRPTWQL